MNKEEKLIELLNKVRDEKSRKELSELIENDPELREDKEAYDQIIHAIKAQGETELRSEIDGYLKNHLNEEGKKIFSLPRVFLYGSIAASITVIVVFFMIRGNQDSKEQHFPLQMNEAPVHADSAIFSKDSLKNANDSMRRN